LATLTFATPLNYLSFLWGYPDTYNELTITSSTGTHDFSASSLGFAVTNGNQSFSQYVQFVSSPGDSILSASFTNSPQMDAFEVDNFSALPIVPGGPETPTGVMVIAGFVGLGFMACRRREGIRVA